MHERDTIHARSVASLLHAPFTDAQSKAIREQLNRLTSHELFSKSARYPRFLIYVVESTLAGHKNTLKERTIGIEVFGQPDDYDSSAIPIVRYCASETRKRLLLYYQAPERQHELRIVMHSGNYTPTFWHFSPASAPHGADVVPVQQSSSATTGKRARVVVLPFENLNDDGFDSFAHGITEQVICRCGLLQDSLAIVASPSTLRCTFAGKSAAQLARELRADYFLAGSTLNAGEQTRVNVRLMNSEEECIWSCSYVSEAPQSLSGQDSLACHIVRQLARILISPRGHVLSIWPHLPCRLELSTASANTCSFVQSRS